MSKQVFAAEEKKLVILEMLRGEKSICQIAKQRGVSDATAYKWRDEVLNAIDLVSKGNAKKGQKGNASIERDRLVKVVGEQALVIDTLKKIAQYT